MIFQEIQSLTGDRTKHFNRVGLVHLQKIGKIQQEHKEGRPQRKDPCIGILVKTQEFAKRMRSGGCTRMGRSFQEN